MLRSSLKEFAGALSSNPSIPFLYVTTIFMFLGQSVISPILPLYVREFGVGTAMIGVVVGAFGVARLIVNLPAGFLAERHGRRILLVGGPAIGAVSSLLLGLAGSLPELIAYRVMYGVGSAMYMTGSMTFIADVTTRENRARLMGLQSACVHFGTSLGPAVGGIIASLWGFRVPFYVLTGLCAFSAVWAYLRLPETRGWVSGMVGKQSPDPAVVAERPARGGRSSLAGALTNVTFMLVCVVTLMLFFTRAASHHTLLPILGAGSKVGLTVGQLGIAFSIISLMNMLMTVPAGILSDHYGRKAVILPGVLLDAASLVLFSFSKGFWSFTGAGVLMGLGSGLANPITTAYGADLARRSNVGITMGLLRTFGDAGYFVGPVLLGWLADRFSYESALWVNAGLLLVVMVLLAAVAKETVGRARQGRRTGSGLKA